MTRRIKLCSKSSLEAGQMLAIDSPDLPPLAAFNTGSGIYVTSNVCTHNVAILTDGFFSDETIECPMHGGCFNVRTGQATQFPCEEPLRTYPVVVDGDDVYIDVEDTVEHPAV